MLTDIVELVAFYFINNSSKTNDDDDEDMEGDYDYDDDDDDDCSDSALMSALNPLCIVNLEKYTFWRVIVIRTQNFINNISFKFHLMFSYS